MIPTTTAAVETKLIHYLRGFSLSKHLIVLVLSMLSCWTAMAQPPVVEGDCGRTTLYFSNATNVSTTIPELSGTTQGSGTWEAWVKKENWGSYNEDEKLFSNDYDYPSESAFYISLHSAPSVGLHFRTGYSGGSYTSNNSTFAFSARSWHHFAATWSESGGTVTTTIYIDGAAAGSITSTSTFDLGSSFYIGGKDGMSKFSNGEMAEVRVWNVARTEQEIADNRNLLLAGDESGLVAYWPLNEASGSTVATNMVSAGSDGTVNYLDASGWRGFPLTVQESGDLILNGDTYDFSTQMTNESSDAQVFTITNQGTSSIDLSTNPISALAGDHTDEFELTSTAISLAAGASTTFSITFSPTSSGAKTAMFSFSNVLDCEDPFEINLAGQALDGSIGYAGDGFSETSANDGSVSGSIIITLSGDTFEDADNNNQLDPDTQFTIPNLPAGFTPVLTLSTSAEAVLTLSGQAANHQAYHSLSDVNFEFKDAAFATKTADEVFNSTSGSGRGISFTHNPILSYSGTGFAEAMANDGSVTGSINIGIVYGSYASSVAIGNGVLVENLPAGFTPVITRNSSLDITLTLEGQAESHQGTNNLGDLTFTFTDAAFENAPASTVFNATGPASSGRGINFLDNTGALAYSGSGFTEAPANDGSVTGSITVTLSGGETFRDLDMDGQLAIGNQITFENIPFGLTPVVSLNSSTEAVLSLTGNAAFHQESNPVTDIQLEFEDAAFDGGSAAAVSNALGPVSTGIGINFLDNPSLTYRGSGFVEVSANDGSVTGSIIVDLTGDTFQDTDASNELEMGSQVTISGVPSGFTSTLTLTSSTQAVLTLAGNAEEHQALDDIDEILFEFTDAAFTSTEAISISRATGPARSTLGIRYQDNSQVVYSGSGFNESLANDGSVTGNIDIALKGEKFQGTDGELSIGSQVTLGNIPDGLSPTVALVKNQMAGVDWIARSASDNDTEWTSVTYGNGLFVAVADHGDNLVMTSPDGVTWTSRQASEDNDWISVTYGNGLFVAVADYGNNRVMTSPDGVTWTGRQASEDNSWTSVTYGNGIFVAVADYGDNRVMTSSDGITWTSRQAAEDNSWTSVTYGDGLFVAVADNGTNRVMTSSDGITWTARQAAEDNSWTSVTYGDGLFVAVAEYGDNQVMTSSDGISWTGRQPSEDSYWQSVTYGNGLFVAVAESGNNSVMASTDGENWTLGEAAEENDWYGLAYAKGQFVAVGEQDYGDKVVMTSGTDVLARLTLEGNATNHTADENVADITFDFSDEAFFSSEAEGVPNATGPASSGLGIQFGNATLAYSGGFTEEEANDGSVAGSIVITLNGDTFNDADANNLLEGSQVAVGNIPDGLTPVFTLNGSSEVEMTLTGNATSHQDSDDIMDITFDFDNSAFENFTAEAITNAVQGSSGLSINFRNNPMITYSGEGFVETTANTGALSGSILLTLTGDKFNDANDNNEMEIGSEVILGNVPDGLTPSLEINSNIIAGVDWLQRELPLDEYGDSPSNDWQSVAYGNGLYVAVADTYGDGDVSLMTSSDGITWTYRDAPSEDWESITYGNGKFVAVTEYYVMTSPDGITWSENSPPDGSWTSVTYGNGLFVAVAESGSNRVMTSTDGVNWVTAEAPNESYWTSVTYGNGLFVAVADYAYGDNYRVMTSTDGVTWNASVLSDSYEWASVTYGDGMFVAVARSGDRPIITSEDGETWASHEVSIIDDGLASVAFGEGVFVVVTNYGSDHFMTSADGETWDQQSIDGRWESIIYGGGQFVAVGSGENAVMTSKTDVSATLHFAGKATNNQELDNVSDITFEFDDVAFLYNEAVKVLNSTGPASSGLGVEYTDNTGTITYLGSGFNESEENQGAVEGNILLTLSGGETFVDLSESGSLEVGNQVVFSNLPGGLVPVVTLNSDTEAQLSFTGNANEHQSLNSVSDILISFENAAFGNGDASLVGNAVGPTSTGFGIDFQYNPALRYEGGDFTETEANDGSVEGSIIITLDGDTYRDDNEDGLLDIDTEVVVNNIPDGLSPVLSITANQKLGDVWEPKSQLNFSYNNMAYGNGIYVAVSGSINNGLNAIGTSTNGSDWDETQFATSIGWIEVIFAKGQFVAVGSDGGTAKVLTSNDGVEWTVQTIPTTLAGKLGIAYGNGLYVVVSSSGEDRIMTSPDGIAWTVAANGLESGWCDVTYGNGMFVAVATELELGKQVMTSTDGENWTFQNGTSDGYWVDLTFGAGLFVAVSDYDYNKMMTSSDGVNWSSAETPSSNNYLSRVTYGGGLFLVPEYDGMKLIKSEDGINWTEQVLTNSIYRTIYAEGQFIAIPQDPGEHVTVSQELSEAKLELSGQATSHQQIHGIADITFAFTDAAFTNTAVAAVFNATGPASSDLGIAFTDNPDNDDCTTPEVLTLYTPGEGTPTDGSTEYAALSNELIPCTEATDIKDVWYSFNSGESGQVVITAELGTALAVSGAVYTSCGEILLVDDLPACANNVDEPVFIALLPNTDFLLQVWNTGEDAGAFSILLEKNLPPSIATIEDKEMDEETEIQFTVTAEDEFLPFGEIEYYLTSEFTDLGMSINSETGHFSWTPSEAQDGVYEVSVLAVDYYDFEGENVSSASATFTLMVNEVNEAPVLAAIENQALAAGDVVEFSALATDADLPANTLTYSLDATSLEKGMSIGGETGAFSWEPLPTYFGMTSEVTLSVSDGELTDQETFTLEVGIGSQTITFGELADRPYSNEPFELTATASSGLSLSYTSSDETVATISGSTVTIVGLGTTTITASQSGNANYEAATDVAQILTVSKAGQIITFAALEAKTFGDAAFNLAATGGASGNAVTYASSNTAIATISGNTVTIIGAGETTITASQAGNDNYNTASAVEQVLTVNKADQTITFEVLAAKTFGDAAFDLAASASSGLGLTFASSDETVATVDGSTVTIVGGGAATITASQSGGVNYEAAEDVNQTLTVNKADQTITFEVFAAKTFGDAAFELAASASSGLGLTFASSDETVATVDGSTVTIVGAGTATITASQSGSVNYEAATSVAQTLTVNKADQTITFSEFEARTFGDAAFELVASSSSGLGLTFTSSDETVATISPASGGTGGSTVTIVGAGTTTITALQSGNANYEAATSVAQTLTVNKMSQTITFEAIETKAFGDTAFELVASASSGLGLTFTSSDETVATISPASGGTGGSTVTIHGAGTATITASQSGNANYDAAVEVSQTLLVSKASQTVTFVEIEAKTFGDAAFELEASSSSDLGLTFTSSDETVATISPASGGTGGSIVTIVGVGTATITASQSGNANYEAATSVGQTLTVNKAGQTITFVAIEAKTFGDAAFELAASASSDLELTFTSSDETVATISPASGGTGGSTVTIVGAGIATITASQSGNANFNEASDVAQTLTVNKISQTITFEAIEAKTFGDPAFELVASSSSDLELTFTSSDETVATVDGSTVTIVGAGTATITASQSGNANYEAATSVAQTLTVNKAGQTITFEAIEAKTFGDAAFELEASSSSDLGLTFTSSDETVATISPASGGTEGSIVTIVGVGTAIISASQSGNVNYEAATSVAQTLTVNKAGQAITFAEIEAKTFGDAAFELVASSSSGLELTFTSSDETVATVDGSTVTIVGAGTATITASQSGNANYEAAADASIPFSVLKATAAIALSNLEQDADGTPKEPTVVTTPEGLPYVLSFDGAETLPVEPGTYELVVTLIDDNYEGTAEASFVLTSNALGMEPDFEWFVFPNPTTDYLEVKSGFSDEVQIYTLNGLEVRNARTNEKIEVADLPAGVYLLKVRTRVIRVLKR